eukprot:gb/GECG01010989.1/.p1 GENE.gb/GECG01010989.1/~~gb/GECG01010989.1/.p1  ORF type:complete len:128 (+),score=6.29 gb/GECG01010989.1/:1-384(+)
MFYSDRITEYWQQFLPKHQLLDSTEIGSIKLAVAITYIFIQVVRQPIHKLLKKSTQWLFVIYIQHTSCWKSVYVPRKFLFRRKLAVYESGRVAVLLKILIGRKRLDLSYTTQSLFVTAMRASESNSG